MCASPAKVFSQRLLPGFGPRSFQEIELGIFLSSCHMCNNSINIYLHITVNNKEKPNHGISYFSKNADDSWQISFTFSQICGINWKLFNYKNVKAASG